MTKKSSNTIFVPYVPNPLDSTHVFTKDENTDELIRNILGNSNSQEAIFEMWYDFFNMHLPFPFNAFAECPIKIKNGNTITSCQLPLTFVELAPLNRCSLDNMILVARKEQDDYGRYVFLQDIRRVENNASVEQILFPFLYWKYFKGKRARK